MALDRGGELALALGRRLLVVLARAELGQQTGFLHRALEAPQRGLERLVFLDPDSRHVASMNSENAYYIKRQDTLPDNPRCSCSASKPPATRPASRSTMTVAACWDTRSTARCGCTPITA